MVLGFTAQEIIIAKIILGGIQKTNYISVGVRSGMSIIPTTPPQPSFETVIKGRWVGDVDFSKEGKSVGDP